MAANTSSIWRTKSVSYWAQFGHTAACENNSNTQGGAPFWFRQCLGRQTKSSGSSATPNPSIERTRSGSAGMAFISFWAKPAPPPRAAHVKR